MSAASIMDIDNFAINAHLFANKHIIMLLIDPETKKIHDANPAACSFYGYSREDMVNLSITDLNILTGEQIDAELTLARNEQRNHFFFQHRLASGEIRFVEVHSIPVKVNNRALMYSIVNDITEQKKAEQEIINFNMELEKTVAERTADLKKANKLLADEISEHIKSEERLQETLEELEDTYNNAPCGYHSLDKDGKFVRVNNTVLKWLGCTREEVLGKPWVDFITPDSCKTFLGSFPKFKEAGWVKDLEFDLIRRDGTIITILLSGTAVYDANGNYIMSRSNSYDITEHKKIKDDLRELNAKLESMVLERTDQLQDMNAELEETNAKLEEEISEREHIEIALRKSEELYRSVYDNSPLAIGIWDKKFRLVDWSKKAEEYFGWTKEEVIGKCFVDFLVPAEIKAAITKVASNIVETGIERVTFNENVTKDGEVLLFEWHNSLLHDENGNLIGIISVGLDKTETFKAEKTIVEANKKIEAANYELSRINLSLKEEIARRIETESTLIKAKFEAEQANIAKSQFLANMSHEIRTPMNGIIGMTDLALMTELKEEQREYLTVVKSSSSLLLRVLNDILDYSKIEANKMDLESEPFTIRDVCNEVVELFTIAAKQKNLYIKLNIDDDVPGQIIGDSVRLRQILSNLVGNSVKFTFDGGINISIKMINKQNKLVSLRFSVIDTGVGIPEDKIDKLFKRFSQVDDSNSRRFGGTGLGLAISKKIIEMMGGEISMNSTEAVGSEFYFTAPFGIKVDSPEIPSAAFSPPEITPHNIEIRPKVLLVEDDEVSRMFCHTLLKKKNLQVVLAENGQEAVTAYENQKFDLIFMDINMPYLDGYAATKLIRQKEAVTGYHTTIIAMTAYAQRGDKDRCLAEGMDDYIAKPIDYNELYRLITIWLCKKV